MGQVLGFSHCQEYGSVASTPDSTPPCTDGGNDESELYELQTAREWSDDGDEDRDDDDDEGLASSPSSWFTPRQNSLELTFSYIAIAEAEAVGTSRQLRDRRRAPSGGRSSRASAPLIRADTLETLLDLPDVEWNPNAFLSREEEEEAARRREQERSEERTEAEREVERRDDGWPGTPPPPPPVQPPPPPPIRPELEPHHRANEDTQREEEGTDGSRPPSPAQTIPRPSAAASPQQHGPPSQSPQVFSQPDGVSSSSCPAAAAVVTTPPTEPESPFAMETGSVTLLASARPRGGVDGDTASAIAAGQSPQEEPPVSGGHWFSALNLPEDLSVCVRVAVMDLIYWKDTERSGMVLTGLVVALLSLFQLSIITVLSTLSLAVVCVTISVRIYYQILHALSWGDGEHPFKAYLDLDTSLSGEQAETYTRKAIVTVLSTLDALKNLVFVGNVFDSLKFLALMYLMTFLGKLFNGLTLLIIGIIALFSLPLYYRQRQEQVDSLLAKVHGHVDNVSDILQRMAHGGSRPPAEPTASADKPKFPVERSKDKHVNQEERGGVAEKDTRSFRLSTQDVLYPASSLRSPQSSREHSSQLRLGEGKDSRARIGSEDHTSVLRWSPGSKQTCAMGDQGVVQCTLRTSVSSQDSTVVRKYGLRFPTSLDRPWGREGRGRITYRVLRRRDLNAVL